MLKPSDADELYRSHGSWRGFGGPLHRESDIHYDPDEHTVMTIRRYKWVLVWQLMLPALILFGLIVSMFYFPSLALYMVLAILLLLLVIGYTVYTFYIYINEAFILTTKRIIDFFHKDHITIEYGDIKDVKAGVWDSPLFRFLDVGQVTVETAGDNPNIEISPVDHPISIQDEINWRKSHRDWIKNRMDKKQDEINMRKSQRDGIKNRMDKKQERKR